MNGNFLLGVKSGFPTGLVTISDLAGDNGDKRVAISDLAGDNFRPGW